ncbi:MAG: hypothetical protein IPH16_08830 [Haliscomenobacter sp.]|nr:hypothetical protein [Haliscomenobacter sp.]MBK8879658.1 hypothetical protein [Haliscomenobacter sp.]
MKFPTLFLPMLLLLAFGSSCTGQKPSNDKTKTETSDELGEPTGDEIREMGIIRNVEDSGYPFFNVVIEFPERQFSETFLLNIEDHQNLDPEVLSKHVGKYAAFFYTSLIKNALLDVRLNGNSLVGVADGDLPEGLQKVSGALSCSADDMGGDLPGVLFITTADDEAFEFEFFLTQELVDANGKQVDGYFDPRTENKIAKIQLLKK